MGHAALAPNLPREAATGTVTRGKSSRHLNRLRMKARPGTAAPQTVKRVTEILDVHAEPFRNDVAGSGVVVFGVMLFPAEIMVEVKQGPAILSNLPMKSTITFPCGSTNQSS